MTIKTKSSLVDVLNHLSAFKKPENTDLEEHEQNVIELSRWLTVYPALWRHAYTLKLFDPLFPPYLRFIQNHAETIKPPNAKKSKREGKKTPFSSSLWLCCIYIETW